MVQCASCKNKTSTEQCPSKAIKGLIFCGRHVKCKDKRIWADINDGHKKAIMIQKHIRGFLVRNYLKILGEGVLKRKDCHNEEELVTMDEKSKVYPLHYFSFREGDKLWWFDIRSLNQICATKHKPENPYTRQTLTYETRKRLREACRFHKLFGFFNLHDKPTGQKSLDQRAYDKWLEVCQIIEENGFYDINPLLLMSLSKTQLFVFLNFIEMEISVYASEHKTKESRRGLYVYWVRNSIQNLFSRSSRIQRGDYISYSVAKTLLSILNDCKQNYDICFIIIKAMCRL